MQLQNGLSGICQVTGKFLRENPLLLTPKEIKLTLALLLAVDLIAYQPAEWIKG